MRSLFIGVTVVVLVAAACAAPASDDGPTSDSGGTPAATSPETTSPVTTSPVTTSPIGAAADTTIPSTTVVVTTTGDPDEPGDDTPTTVTTQPPKETPVTTTQPVEPNPAGPVAAVVADLAARLDIDGSAITVISVEEVTWPDGSLGCPQPGMSYTQVLVNGSLIVLEANGATYEYHSGGRKTPFYCANPTEPISGDYGDT